MAFKNIIETNKQFSFETSNEIISVLFRDKDPSKGILLPQENISSITIDESMFSLLPKITINFSDSGRFFTVYNIKNGDSMYVKITPRFNDNKNSVLPYIDTQFTVQSFLSNIQPGESKYSNSIIGVYNAQNYLNEIISYPSNEGVLSLLPSIPETSKDVIKNVLKNTSLNYVEDFETSPIDYGKWINCNDTRANFIDKVVSHSYISNTQYPDCTILFTDINGNCKYTSLKTLCKKEIKSTFKNIKLAVNSNKDSKSLLYDNIQFLNASGPVLNNGGYKVSQNLYTPFKKYTLDSETFKMAKDETLDNISNDNIQSLINGDSSDGFRKFETKVNTNYLGNINNKAIGSLNNLTKNVDTGIKFQETHDYYDVAPAYNESIRRNFFQNFIMLVIDSFRLPDLFKNGSLRPKLGDKVYIDFSNNKGVDTIHSGNYIIVAMKHSCIKKHTYSIKIYCVSDGYYGEN